MVLKNSIALAVFWACIHQHLCYYIHDVRMEKLGVGSVRNRDRFGMYLAIQTMNYLRILTYLDICLT